MARAVVLLVRLCRLMGRPQVDRAAGGGRVRGVTFRSAPPEVDVRPAAPTQCTQHPNVRQLDAGENGGRSHRGVDLSRRGRAARHHRHRSIVHPRPRRALAVRAGAAGFRGADCKAMDSLSHFIRGVPGRLSRAELGGARWSGLGRLRARPAPGPAGRPALARGLPKAGRSAGGSRVSQRGRHRPFRLVHTRHNTQDHRAYPRLWREPAPDAAPRRIPARRGLLDAALRPPQPRRERGRGCLVRLPRARRH